MLSKLKTGCTEFRFGRKLAIIAFVTMLATFIHVSEFQGFYPGGSVYESVIYSLSDSNYFMVLFPMLCLVFTTGINQTQPRYPVFMRYKTRSEYFYVKLTSRVIFAACALFIHIVFAFIAGHALPKSAQHVMVSADNSVGIIVGQCLNMLCFVSMVLLLHEIWLDVIENVFLDIILTSSVLLINWVVYKLVLQEVIAWTPWGHVGYIVNGMERASYSFYWSYWLAVILVLLLIADVLHDRKDYVFEEARKVG